MLKRVQQVFGWLSMVPKEQREDILKSNCTMQRVKSGPRNLIKIVNTWNLSFANYAPFNDPEITIKMPTASVMLNRTVQLISSVSGFFGHILTMMKKNSQLQKEIDIYLLQV